MGRVGGRSGGIENRKERIRGVESKAKGGSVEEDRRNVGVENERRGWERKEKGNKKGEREEWEGGWK